MRGNPEYDPDYIEVVCPHCGKVFYWYCEDYVEDGGQCPSCGKWSEEDHR